MADKRKPTGSDEDAKIPHVKLDPVLHKKLKVYAAENDTSMKEVVEALVTKLLKEKGGS